MNNPKTTKMKYFLPVLIMFSLTGCLSFKSSPQSIKSVKGFDTQMKSLTKQMVRSLSNENKSKIAIMEFPDLNDNVSELSRFIPEELTTRLFMTKRFDVVERSLLNKVLQEQNLGMSGLIDASSAAKIGKMLGVDAIVTGTITDLGNMYRLNARIIATETASVFAVSSVSIEKEAYLVAMMNKVNVKGNNGNGTKEKNEATGGEQEKNEELSGNLNSGEPQTSQSAVFDKIKVEVVSATWFNYDQIELYVCLTNQSKSDQEVDIWLNKWTNMYDDLGHEYMNASVEIGSKSSDYSLKHLLVPGIPTHFVYYFNSINTEAKYISRLRLWLKNGNDEDKNALILRNILIQ